MPPERRGDWPFKKNKKKNKTAYLWYGSKVWEQNSNGGGNNKGLAVLAASSPALFWITS